MPKTRLYVECPNCHMQYLMKEMAALTYSNGAYIENVAGQPDWQRLVCPCQPEPHKFKLSETQRLHVFSIDENEKTHYPPKKPTAANRGKDKDRR